MAALRCVVVLVAAGILSMAGGRAARAQDGAGGDGGRVVRLGLLGFGTSVGVDFEGDNQLLVFQALDLGHLLTPRLRLRPSAEIAVSGDPGGFVGNAELIFRLLPDSKRTVPYLGGGLGVATREGCSADPDCPTLWAQAALGVELGLTDRFGWVVEYHAEDGFRRHRFFFGLTTRRAG